MNKYLLSLSNFSYLHHFNFLPALLIRFYLAIIFWVAGTNLLLGREKMISFMGTDLGLTSPEFLFYLLVATQLMGAISLFAGFALRWITLPLMAIMILAALFIHQNNGWLWIIDENSAVYSTEYTQSYVEELKQMKTVLQENGIANTNKLTLLNNGIEKPAIYFLMLLTLFFMGAGRYFSLDYYIHRFFTHKVEEKEAAKTQHSQPILLPVDTLSNTSTTYEENNHTQTTEIKPQVQTNTEKEEEKEKAPMEEKEDKLEKRNESKKQKAVLQSKGQAN